ncbi:hypothetical protein SNR37_000345 [Agarivorans aestuarii]|uniref:Lipoprotein n=1 Tax=Agarivorans aestuarii TaxID=1563703 RepID=A0ABU7G6T6_9ALTE|nr:hypothetical protein [Agarivorans aestuarii]MEE1675023.1 hypothetical protein [Agarivorans aestuarii]
MIKKILVTIVTAISMGCVGSAQAIEPYFAKGIGFAYFFTENTEINNASDFGTLRKEKWSYPTDLKHSDNGKVEVYSCEDLVSKMDAGYTEAIASEYVNIQMQYKSCRMWHELVSFKSSQNSYLDPIDFNKEFAKQTPPQLGFIISKDDERRMIAANSWDDMSRITKVELNDTDGSAIFYDDTGGKQELWLRAKGDYNDDGIEDALFTMSNTVEGGSYHSVHYYVLTRLSPDAPYTLLKQW